MGNNHDLSDNNKHSDYLEISLANMVSPVVRSQGYMLMTTEVGIIQQNQSMLVVT